MTRFDYITGQHMLWLDTSNTSRYGRMYPSKILLDTITDSEVQILANFLIKSNGVDEWYMPTIKVVKDDTAINMIIVHKCYVVLVTPDELLDINDFIMDEIWRCLKEQITIE